MTTLYLIRHAEAEGNLYRRAQGQYDAALSPKGEKQLDALAERFRTVPLDALYSSDLRRTQRTAGAITKYHALPLHLEPRLREMALGVWEDRPFGDLAYAEPEMMDAFNNDPAAWHAEGAEGFLSLQRRMLEAVTEIAARHDGQSVAVVSHGMAIRALLAAILAVPSREIYKIPHGDNTAVSRLRCEGGAFTVEQINDNSHLLTAGLSTLARQDWWKEPGRVDLNNIRFQRLDPRKYPGLYTSCYEKTWRAVHGSLDGFQAPIYLDAAARHVAACPDALVTIVRPDDTVVGITELDTERSRAEHTGWICLCYVEEDCRRALLGVQLIGHAVSVFRRMGYKRARLCVYEGNTDAIAFYTACQFHTVGETSGSSGGRLFIMEKAL
ncbi:MAG: bifunctional histidine phosphatase family protein/GNAT family N-acetyltransferase [Oscillospiraceae bacterium]|nr:bifunctional histidine phosphatase family protein/GNAT family N-acetyltransferase [Oscillospiraceae bacterium]MCD8357712.1 bifunctional histidine phosphatase family protein/GNAT family N-acetyltransferase [Oscillospiraceae bacterium]MCD8389053.1 bifunctional histidine phosphatase family protein/GNAT family N-acetyltransferase [Oscillospiraceae bacterium]